MQNIDWSFALSDDFPLDKTTYLLTSIIPLSYVMELNNGEQVIAVDISDIRSMTKSASEGCRLLVAEGLAKWVEEPIYDRRNPTSTHSSIAIGYAENFMPRKFYFEDIVVSSLKVTEFTEKIIHKRKPAKNKKYDFSEVMDGLLIWTQKFRQYCTNISRNASYMYVTDRLREILDNAEREKFTATDFIDYLDCVNAIVYDRTTIDKEKKGNIKMRTVAKSLIEKHNIPRIIEIVPYFVENYPNIADPKYMDTNIFMLNSHFDKMQLMKDREKKPTKKNYEDDEL